MFRSVSINSRGDLLRAVREERQRRGITGEAFDDIVGLTRAHCVKIENANKPWGRQAFNFTPSMAWILEALGLRLILVSAEEAGRLTGQEIKSAEETYSPNGGESPPRRPSTMVVYDWNLEPASQR